MNLLLGSLTIGFILSLLGLGIYISFWIFSFPDMTADGSIVVGAAVAARLMLAGVAPLPATLAGMLAGALAGMVTGIIHTVFKVNNLLAGILTMTALYSINLHIMGRSNLPLLNIRTLSKDAAAIAQRLFGSADINLLGWQVNPLDITQLLLAGGAVMLVALVLYAFFRTQLGMAMRATGDNDQMIRALGGNTNLLKILGLALSNALIALSGALLAQYQGFADVQMGIGMLVWGLASVIIGMALARSNRLGFALSGAIIGSILFRLLVAIALRWGLNPNDLKLVTALFVFATLVLPGVLAKLTGRKKKYQTGVPHHA
ncbi:MAG: ABC transporter permease [Spartobacteria bacterium]|nr:ABC transporter permease [Spartobacteria bacterium]